MNEFACKGHNVKPSKLKSKSLVEKWSRRNPNKLAINGSFYLNPVSMAKTPTPQKGRLTAVKILQSAHKCPEKVDLSSRYNTWCSEKLQELMFAMHQQQRMTLQWNRSFKNCMISCWKCTKTHLNGRNIFENGCHVKMKNACTIDSILLIMCIVITQDALILSGDLNICKLFSNLEQLMDRG